MEAIERTLSSHRRAWDLSRGIYEAGKGWPSLDGGYVISERTRGTSHSFIHSAKYSLKCKLGTACTSSKSHRHSFFLPNKMEGFSKNHLFV